MSIPSGYSMVSCANQLKHKLKEHKSIRNQIYSTKREGKLNQFKQKKLLHLVLNYKTKWCIYYCNITENRTEQIITNV